MSAQICLQFGPWRSGELRLVASFLHQRKLTIRRFSGLQAYFLSISAFLHKMDGLRWTPHLEESLKILQERQECPNDEMLVQQVRLQLISEKVAHGTWDGSTKIPLSFYVKALQSQVQEVIGKLPARLQCNGKPSSTYTKSNNLF